MTNAVKANTTSRVTKANVTYKAVNHALGGGSSVDTSRFRYNQSPVETPNGVLTVFTLPNSESFVTGLIEVFINGNQKIKAVEWEETGTTQITLLGTLATTPPESTEVIKLNYIRT